MDGCTYMPQPKTSLKKSDLIKFGLIKKIGYINIDE